jgi:NADH-quinone oxidoreductase subunit J
MEALFYVAGGVAILATLFMLASSNAVHALLNLIVSLLAVALVFYTFGAAFAAALEAIVYAGAIMVLFVFAVMLLNPGDETVRIRPGDWAGPAALAAILVAQLVYVVTRGPKVNVAPPVDPKQVGIALFGPYVIGVELASVLLLAGLVGAFHIGRRYRVQVSKAQVSKSKDEPHVADSHAGRTDSGSDLVFAWSDRPSRAS